MEMFVFNSPECLHGPVFPIPLGSCVNKACFVVGGVHSWLEEKGFSRKHQEKKKTKHLLSSLKTFEN